MQELKKSIRTLFKNEYNDEPVAYCNQCLSLAIRDYDGNTYCDKCGGTHIKETNIFEWEKLYKDKYNEEYIK